MIKFNSSDRISLSLEALRILIDLNRKHGAELSAPTVSAIHAATAALNHEVESFFGLDGQRRVSYQANSVRVPTVA